MGISEFDSTSNFIGHAILRCSLTLKIVSVILCQANSEKARPAKCKLIFDTEGVWDGRAIDRKLLTRETD